MVQGPATFDRDSSKRAPDSSHLPLDLRFDGPHPRTTQEFIYAVVRRAIMRGELRPGDKLGQEQLANQLGVSTTPVREALRRLAGEGLVQMDAHRGALVRGLDEEELSEICELRLLLEPLAVRKAAERITDPELAEAQRLCERMNDHSDMVLWSDLNRDFHTVIADAARSPKLTGVLRGLRDSAAPYIHWWITLNPELPASANIDHRELLDALRLRDGDAAAAIEEKHVRAILAVNTGIPPAD